MDKILKFLLLSILFPSFCLAQSLVSEGIFSVSILATPTVTPTATPPSDSLYAYGSGTTPSPANTQYMSPNGTNQSWSNTENNSHLIVAVAGSFNALYSRFDAAVTPGTWTFTLVKNGVDQALTCTMSNTQTCNDTSHSVSVAVGDTISLKSDPVGTDLLPLSSEHGLNFVPTTYGEALISGSQGGGANFNAATRYFVPQESTGGGGNANILGFGGVVSAPGVVDHLYAALSASPGAGSYLFTLYKNGVATALSASCTGTTCNDTSNSVSVVAGDVLSFEVKPQTSPTAVQGTWGMRWVPTVPGQNLLMSGAASLVSSSTRYYGIQGGQTNSTVETSRQQMLQARTVKNLYADMSAAATNSATLAIMQNGVATALTCTIAGGGTTCNDTTHSLTVAAGDRLSLRVVTSGTIGSGSLHVGLTAIP